MILSLLYAHESDLIYQSNNIADIHITVNTNALTWIYNNVDSDSLHLSSIRYQNDSLDISMDSVGFRLRGNTSRNAAKKSFKLDFNQFVPGRKLSGVEKLNLKAEQNDPSLVRSNFAFSLMEKIGLEASRLCYARVYINDNYMGLYNIIEHIDENFLNYHFANNDGNLYKCLYPADLNYYGPDPLYHPNAAWDPNRPYEIKTNKLENDHRQLAHLIDVINHTLSSDLMDSLESVLQVTDFIKYLAVNIMTGSWDDYRYLRNNYYLYYDIDLAKFRFIPYDYDNTFGIDWVGSSNWGDPNWARINMYSYTVMDSDGRPLSELIFNTPEYRDLFTHFIQFYTNNVFKEDQWTDYGDSIKALIRPDVVNDTYYPRDHGFNMSIFDDSYDEDQRYRHVERGIYEFMRKRRQTTNGDINWRYAAPSIYRRDIEQIGTSLHLDLSVFSAAGIKSLELKLYDATSNENSSIAINMDQDSQSNLVELYDRWTLRTQVETNDHYYKIVATDINNQVSTWPRKGFLELKDRSHIYNSLFINEIMAKNDASIADPAGDYDDWVEIYNASSQSIDMEGMFLSDREDSLAKWDFPENTIIHAGDYLLIWCDKDGDQHQDGLHANFKLSTSGEYISLTDKDSITVIDEIHFPALSSDVSYGRNLDGGDNWITFSIATPGATNNETDIDVLIPMTTALFPNYPNPFNPRTAISYQLSTASNIEVNIFNAMGRKVHTLVNNYQQAGVYKHNWDASHLASGIYLAVMKVDGFVFGTQKMLLVK